MTEQYKSTYQNKYREETAQVHAPLSLIEKTKAAMREEEKRLAMAGAAPAKQEEIPVSNFEDANRQKSIRVLSVRKWAYPLTAAAAILILASVSLTMRGLKTVYMSDTAMPAAMDEAAESGAVYEAASDEDYEEMAVEAAAADEPIMDAYAPVDDMAADMAEGATGTDDRLGAQDTGGAGTADAGQMNSLADMTPPAEEKLMEEAAENEDRGSAEMAQQKSAADAQKRETAVEQRRGDADADDFTIEKVTKRPARFNSSDAEIQRYEGKTFRILETTSAGDNARKTWEAYVEVLAGEGYVICGEAESVEDFLAAAWEKLNTFL